MGLDTQQRRAAQAQSKRESGGFVAMPYIVIRSEEWGRLSAHAVKALMDLVAQYSGSNNGDFDACWEKMSTRGWRSKDTLYKGINELMAAKFIIKTRQGQKRKGFPTLYGVTFHKLNDCRGKLDVSGSDFRGAWRKNQNPPKPPEIVRYPKNADARAALRAADPVRLKALVRQEFERSAALV